MLAEVMEVEAGTNNKVPYRTSDPRFAGISRSHNASTNMHRDT